MACVNQKSEQACAALGKKCAWAGKAKGCLGKELVGVCNSTPSNSTRSVGKAPNPIQPTSTEEAPVEEKQDEMPTTDSEEQPEPEPESEAEPQTDQPSPAEEAASGQPATKPKPEPAADPPKTAAPGQPATKPKPEAEPESELPTESEQKPEEAKSKSKAADFTQITSALVVLALCLHWSS